MSGVYELLVAEVAVVATMVPPTVLFNVFLYHVYPVTEPVFIDTLVVKGASVAFAQALTASDEGCVLINKP